MTNSYILYSRTLENDYRWIYYDQRISQKLRTAMMDDYHNFEGQKDLFLLNNSHFVYHCDALSGAVIYRFCKMNNCDIVGRKIYGMHGLFVDLSQIKMMQDNLVVYIYYFILSAHEYLDHKEIDDHKENSNKKIDISLDSMWKIYNEKKERQIIENLTKLLNSIGTLDLSRLNIYYPKPLEPVSQRLEDQDKIQNRNNVNRQTEHNLPVQKPDFDYQLIESELSKLFGFQSAKIVCKKCNKKRKMKTISLDLCSKKPTCQNSDQWNVQIKSDEELFACQCESCKSKYIISKQIKIIKEW